MRVGEEKKEKGRPSSTLQARFDYEQIHPNLPNLYLQFALVIIKMSKGGNSSKSGTKDDNKGKSDWYKGQFHEQSPNEDSPIETSSTVEKS